MVRMRWINEEGFEMGAHWGATYRAPYPITPRASKRERLRSGNRATLQWGALWGRSTLGAPRRAPPERSGKALRPCPKLSALALPGARPVPASSMETGCSAHGRTPCPGKRQGEALRAA